MKGEAGKPATAPDRAGNDEAEARQRQRGREGEDGCAVSEAEPAGLGNWLRARRTEGSNLGRRFGWERGQAPYGVPSQAPALPFLLLSTLPHALSVLPGASGAFPTPSL